jgi:S1/P1 Nuclease
MNRHFSHAACLAVFVFCCAWGATGHKVVAQIAYDHLTPKAKAEVDKLLAGSTLAEFSIWPDLIKNDPAWKWTKPWHYADMEEGETEFKMEKDCPKEGCVVSGIQRYEAVLKSGSASQEEKTQALKFLSHYVGDIHQPLHVGHKKDKGGNSIEVQLYSRKTNLHAVWEDGLIKRRGMDYQPYAKKLEGALTPEVQKADLAVMDPVAWATESHRIAEAHAYKDKGKTIKSGDTLGDDYANANSPIIDEQLTKAGLRLAKMLNAIYDPGAETPAIAAMAPSAPH